MRDKNVLRLFYSCQVSFLCFITILIFKHFYLLHIISNEKQFHYRNDLFLCLINNKTMHSELLRILLSVLWKKETYRDQLTYW